MGAVACVDVGEEVVFLLVPRFLNPYLPSHYTEYAAPY